MSIRADAESLQRIPLFRSCDPVPLQILAFSAERVSFDVDDAIITEGESPHGAYLIMSGSASLVRGSRIVGAIEEGTFLGETAMIGGTAYSVTVRAREQVQAAKIDRNLFMRVATEYPEFGRSVIDALGMKLGDTVRDFDRIRHQLGQARLFSDP